MRFLVDTQSWLWMQTTPERLNQRVLDVANDPTTYLLLSAASSWEIAIKYALGKLPLPSTPEMYVPDRMRTSGVRALPITHSHALRVAQLPGHHRDPFDRLLIAQAQLDSLTIMTSDKVFERYDVPVLWSN